VRCPLIVEFIFLLIIKSVPFCEKLPVWTVGVGVGSLDEVLHLEQFGEVINEEIFRARYILKEDVTLRKDLFQGS
jgi:hypothetical protein